jgi:hypothetical protein
MDSTQASAWLQLTQQFGLPLVLFFGLLALLLAGLFFLLRWARPRVDRVIDALVDLINSQKDEQKRIGDCLKEVGEELEDVKGQLVGLHGHADSSRVEFGRVLGKLDLLLDRAARVT